MARAKSDLRLFTNREGDILKIAAILFSFTLLFFLYGCDNQETELVITEEKSQSETIANEQVANVTDTAKPLLIIKPEDSLEILVRADGAPGMYLGDDGELHGFYVDLEKMIMNEMGQAYHLRAYSDVGPVAQGLKSGVYHIALAAPDLPEYRSFLNLSIPYEILHLVTFVQDGNEDIHGETLEAILRSLHGKKVGVQTRGHLYQALRDIREIELVEYPTTTKALADLNNGLLDAVPDVKRIVEHYTVLYDWEIKPVGVPIMNLKNTTAFSKTLHGSLLERYNISLKKLISDGRFEALRESHFGAN